ncbi:NACHT, LRR and PYD domains-containing protein 1b allele 2-like [Ciona intestinalis]
MHVERYGNIVCVVGQPGVGKSTVLKMLLNCIIEDKSVKPDTEFFFPISLKNFNPDKKISLLEFLLHDSWSDWNHSDAENQALILFLYNNPNVLILIDGWDELNTNLRVYECQLESIDYPEVFIKNLLMGKLLPKAAKVITSRPDQFYELPANYRQGLVSEVRGMDKPAKRNLTKQMCGEANLESVEKLLSDRPDLDALCDIPVQCIHIIACLNSSVSSGREMNSMTQVLISTIINIKESDHLKANMSERKLGRELVKLAELAYEGLSAGKLVFQQNDFDKVGINEQTVDMFLHTYVEKSQHLKTKMLQGKKRSCFPHIIWQEVFAAVHLILFMAKEDFRRCMDTFTNPHWKVVTRFMFGICNSASYKDLKVIFQSCEIKDYERKKQVLKSLITLKDQNDLSKDVITFSGWVHEANDAEISQEFKECMPQCIAMRAPRHLTQVPDVLFAFNTFKTALSLNLTIVGPDDAAYEALLVGLDESKIWVKRLNIRNVEMTESTTEALVPHLEGMNIFHMETWSDNKKLEVYMKEISKRIMDRKKKIKLKLVGTAAEHAKLFIPCLDKISELKYDKDCLSREDRCLLEDEIEKLASPKVKQILICCIIV